MSPAEELLAAVRRRTVDSPYTVTEVPGGFDVSTDLDESRWHGLFSERHLAEAWTFEVRLREESKKLTITDVRRTVRWQTVGPDGASVPVAVSAGVTRGRVAEKRFLTTVDTSDPEPTGTTGWTFSSSDGRDLVREPARELGWGEQLGREQKIGLVVAIAAVGLVVLGGIVVGIVALAGGFS